MPPVSAAKAANMLLVVNRFVSLYVPAGSEDKTRSHIPVPGNFFSR